jgi:uncharacterized protein (TIGR02001 family)
MMKKTLIASALLASSTAVMAEISGNVALTNDYRFRGISQTDGDAAIQGGFDYAHDSGLYLGVWGSNVSFLGGGSVELDYYGGYAGDLTDAIGFDVGAIYYDYPGDEASGVDLEFWEVYGGLSGDLGQVSLSGTISYTSDYFAETGDAVYYDLGAELPLPAGFTLAAHYGYQTIDDGEAPPKGKGFFNTNEDSYSDWSVGVSKSYWGVDFNMSYVDTDLSDTDCFSTANVCDGVLVFSVGKSL